MRILCIFWRIHGVFFFVCTRSVDLVTWKCMGMCAAFFLEIVIYANYDLIRRFFSLMGKNPSGTAILQNSSIACGAIHFLLYENFCKWNKINYMGTLFRHNFPFVSYCRLERIHVYFHYNCSMQILCRRRHIKWIAFGLITIRVFFFHSSVLHLWRS